MISRNPLWHGDVWRWLVAGLLLAVSGYLIVTYAVSAVDGRNTRAAAILGNDRAFRKRLYDGPSGLSLRLDQGQRNTLARLIAEDPLDSSAVALAALDRQAQGDRASARALGDQAIRIEPRTRLAWLARLERQVRGRDNVAAAISAMRLIAFDTTRALTYLPVLVQLAKDPRTTPVISTTLATNPTWRSPLVGLLMLGKVDPTIRYALMNPDKPAKSPEVDADRGFFLNDLVGRGEFERAYLAWLSFLPESALSDVGIPYDASFQGLPGAVPFNWQVSTADGDQASIDGGMLRLSYSGRQTATLARQIVLLTPGDYRLGSVIASSDSQTASGTTLTWNVRCLPNNEPISSLALNPAIVRRAQQAAPFVVPADCAAAALQIDGTASEFPARVTMGIASVELKHVRAVAPAAAVTAMPARSARP